jgi:hypothetical protein
MPPFPSNAAVPDHVIHALVAAVEVRSPRAVAGLNSCLGSSRAGRMRDPMVLWLLDVSYCTPGGSGSNPKVRVPR